jgi:hypothetical protein
MHPAARASLLLVVAATALATANARAWAAADVPAELLPNATVDTVIEGVREAIVRLHLWVLAGYAKRPTVMLGLGGALALPLLVFVGFLLYRRQAKPPLVFDMTAAGPPGLYAARIEIEGANAVELPNGGRLLQIGRQRDNDICIEDETVSRYHAVIERSGDGGFTITDVSSQEGGGIRINGEPILRAVLSDGDTVELGRTRMRVAAAL